MSLKPWREVAVLHQDVLEGTFQQSEFAFSNTRSSKQEIRRKLIESRAVDVMVAVGSNLFCTAALE